MCLNNTNFKRPWHYGSTVYRNHYTYAKYTIMSKQARSIENFE